MAVIFFLVFLTSYSMSGYEISIPLLAKDRLNINSYELGLMFTFMGLVGVIVQGVLVGRMIKKMGEALNIKVGLMIAALGYGLTFLVKDISGLVVFACLAVVGQGILRPSLISLISKDTVLEEGATMGAMQSVDSFGRILGPVVAGFLFQLAQSSPYLSTGSFNLLAFLVFLFI
jgi:MFS family permease